MIDTKLKSRSVAFIMQSCSHYSGVWKLNKLQNQLVFILEFGIITVSCPLIVPAISLYFHTHRWNLVSWNLVGQPVKSLGSSTFGHAPLNSILDYPLPPPLQGTCTTDALFTYESTFSLAAMEVTTMTCNYSSMAKFNINFVGKIDLDVFSILHTYMVKIYQVWDFFYQINKRTEVLLFCHSHEIYMYRIILAIATELISSVQSHKLLFSDDV